jgi:RNA polymerase sigma-70 factor (ECF subfamily)
LKGRHAVLPDFEELVTAHSGPLYAYLWRLLRNPADAEDSLQDTFLRAFRAYPRTAGHSNHRAWLYRIATNVARTRQKQAVRAAQRTVALEPELAAAGPGVPEQVAERHTLAAVSAAVAALPEQQRAALILRKYQDLEYSEIAAVLNCTEAAARANVYQALKKLRQLDL